MAECPFSVIEENENDMTRPLKRHVNEEIGKSESFDDGKDQYFIFQTIDTSGEIFVSCGDVFEGGEFSSASGENDFRSRKTFRVTSKKKSLPPTGSAVHICLFCDYKTSKRFLLTRHMKSHSEEKPHLCSVCDKGFKTLASLQSHAYLHTETKPYRCKYCNRAFTTSGQLQRHTRYRHTFERPYNCEHCTYSCVEFSKLVRHVRCHTGERPYQCPHCTYASADSFKLKRHIRIHTGEKPYQCEFCQMRFSQSNSLTLHRQTHTGEKPVFQCSFCPATCGRNSDLRYHIQKLHTSDRVHSCKRCGQIFADRYSYKIHLKDHEAANLLKCSSCQYTTSNADRFASHVLLHTVEKAFKCAYCDQAFHRQRTLRCHETRCHAPKDPVTRGTFHKCLVCSKSFRQKGNLNRHMALQHHIPRSLIKKLVFLNGTSAKEGTVEATGSEELNGQTCVLLEELNSSNGDGVLDLVYPSTLSTLILDSGNTGAYTLEVDEIEDDTKLDLINVGDGLIPDLKESVDFPPPPQDLAAVFRREITISMRKQSMATLKDMANCFGFDDEEAPDEFEY